MLSIEQAFVLMPRLIMPILIMSRLITSICIIPRLIIHKLIYHAKTHIILKLTMLRNRLDTHRMPISG